MSNKQKQILLALGIIIVLVLCYQFGISKTIEQKARFNALKAKELVSKNAPKQLAVYKTQERYYDSLLMAYQMHGSSFQNNLLKTITAYSNLNKVKLISFLEPHRFKQNNLNINTYEFTLQGPYNSINNLIYQLEQKTKFGEIVHLHFKKKINFRTGRNYLQAKVLLRSYGG